MSRIAPNLAYLTIYNPTLRPGGPVAPDDEDAEEQAHILFYTSKERAVSRDRMLRQVGLAKALISFSDMFNAEDPCNNVHSQGRRMVMVSPEPNFWVHAGIDLAKTPRPPVDKGKGKGKEKEKSKGELSVLYDYHEHSVYDVAVQADIMRGYEKFKLRHGSLASILSTLGQQALELQLERFFTVWAWSWNIEDGPEFGEHLGPPLHPLYSSLVPSLDDFSSQLPEEVVAIAISPPYLIPSTRYTGMDYPRALPTFLLSLLPPPQHLFSPPPVADSTIKASNASKAPLPPPSSAPPTPPKRDDSSFLGMNLDLGVKMDMPKWNWLTFGKGSKRPPEVFAVTPMNEDKGNPNPAARPPDTPGQELEQTTDFEVDRSALEDAMFSDRIPMPLPNPIEKSDAADGDGRSLSDTIVPRKEDSEAADVPGDTQVEVEPVVEERELPAIPEPEPVVFSATTVHLARPDEPQATRRRRVFYLVRDRVLVALLGLDGEGDDASLEPDLSAETLRPVADAASALLDTLITSVSDPLKSETDLLPSATKILQPKDRWALAAPQFTLCSPEFESHAGHLYEARRLLRASDPEIAEVFSRGQNPQHWHVARRGLGTEQESEEGGAEKEVYMEVFRKEASLTDVDNALAGVVRKSTAELDPRRS
ncbi:hypothetical protein C8R43DRAFT_1043786 [Mycena crocata]|nr:hypothetical protein C8R43DRAFT_1043786 [Mycena crocata]